MARSVDVMPHQGGRPDSLLGNALNQLLLCYALAAFALVCLVWSSVSFVLQRLLPPASSQRIGPRLVHLASWIYLRLCALTGQIVFDLSALDALDSEGGLIIAPNHPSLLDAVLVISRLPRTICIAKAELWDNPLLGAGMRMAGYIRNDSPTRQVRSAVAKLRAGQQLLLFPEGTRTVRPPVNPFRGGFAVTAKLAGVAVQTVFIETSSPFLGKGWPLLKVPPVPIVYRVRLGRRFEPGEDARTFAQMIERYFQGELAGSSPPAARP